MAVVAANVVIAADLSSSTTISRNGDAKPPNG
jgi:hypothetical protein